MTAASNRSPVGAINSSDVLLPRLAFGHNLASHFGAFSGCQLVEHRASWVLHLISFSYLLGAGAALNSLGVKVVGVAVFAHHSRRNNAMLSKQPAYVFAVVKKHLNS